MIPSDKVVEPYQYKALLESDSIRIIKLHPSPDKAATVQCELIHTTLHQIQAEIIDHYTALSYVWGDPAERPKIHIGNRTLEVTKSLDSALKHLRDKERILNIWADGICINQQDDDEKSIQVALMGEIYRFAHHTVIFLGECDADEELVLYGLLSVDEPQGLGNGQLVKELAPQFRKLLSRAWFYRVWIFQELVLSHNPKVQWGYTRCDWEMFWMLARLFAEFEPAGKELGTTQVPQGKPLDDTTISPFRRGAELVSSMQKARYLFQSTSLQQRNRYFKDSNKPWQGYINQIEPSKETSKYLKAMALKSFIDLLLSRRGFGVTDPRDMVFAHLGLVQNTGVQVDYQKSAGQVYATLAKETIQAFRNLEMLSYVNDLELEFRRDGLPSWAPDWCLDSHRPPKRIMELVGYSIVSSMENARLSLKEGHFRMENGPVTDGQPFWTKPSPYFWVRNDTILCSPGYFYTHPIDEISNVLRNLESGAKRLDSLADMKDPPLDIHEFLVSDWSWEWWNDTLGPTKHILSLLTTRESNKTMFKATGKSERLLDHLAYRIDERWTTGSVMWDARRKENSIFDGRRLASVSDRLALVPTSSKPGDRVCFLRDCPVPFVVREMSESLQEMKDSILEGANMKRELDIKYVSLIGECLLEDAVLRPENLIKETALEEELMAVC